MSLISYVNSILNEDLSEIGLKRKKGLEWYKLIDNMFYVFHLLSTTSTRHSCCARLILGKYESDNSILG